MKKYSIFFCVLSVFVLGSCKKFLTEKAEDQFMNLAIMHEIGNEIDFVVSESHRLERQYPKILVAPMLYKMENNRLYLIDEND